MVSVDGDFLVGVIVGIVCEHLERENTALSPEVETAARVKSWCFSSDREHGSLTGFLLVSSRVSFHALRKTWTGVKHWWMVVIGRQSGWDGREVGVLTWTHPRCWRTGWLMSRLWAGPRCDSPSDYSPVETNLQPTNKFKESSVSTNLTDSPVSALCIMFQSFWLGTRPFQLSIWSSILSLHCIVRERFAWMILLIALMINQLISLWNLKNTKKKPNKMLAIRISQRPKLLPRPPNSP